MTITREQARQDIENVMSQYETLGQGRDVDRAAQLVVQTVEVLERRLGNKGAIKLVYFELQDASKLLPPSVYGVARDYIEGKIEEPVARQRLQEIQKGYKEVFREMGVSPTVSAALFARHP
jgi:hypothetical protein